MYFIRVYLIHFDWLFCDSACVHALVCVYFCVSACVLTLVCTVTKEFGEFDCDGDERDTSLAQAGNTGKMGVFTV